MSETPISDALRGILDIVRDQNNLIRALAQQQTGLACALRQSVNALPEGENKTIALNILDVTLADMEQTLKAINDEAN
jgi:hypothetical protein